MSVSSNIRSIIDNTNIEGLVEDISNSTTSSIRNIQKSFIPVSISQDIDTVLDFYTYNGRIYKIEDSVTIIFDNSIIKSSYLRYLFYEENKLKDLKRDRNVMSPFKNLVDSDYLHNLLIFINKRFVKWSDMTFIGDYHYNYIMINGYNVDDIEEIQLIYLPPKGVKYTEGEVIESSGRELRFNSLGELDMESDDTVISFTYPDLLIEYFDTAIISSNIPESKITSTNIFKFTNGLLNKEEAIQTNYNEFEVGENTQSFIFYYKIDYRKVEHIDKIENKELAKEIYKESSENNPFKDIFNTLEINYKEFANDEDLEKSIRTIVDYDRTLFGDVTADDTIHSLTFTGVQIKTSAVDGIYKITAPRKETDSAMLMFVNGELYSLYNEITKKYGEYRIPIREIESTDKVEFLFFMNVENLQYPFTPENNLVDISVVDPNTVTLLSPYRLSPKNRMWNYKIDEDVMESLFYHGMIILITKHKIYKFKDEGYVISLDFDRTSSEEMVSGCFGKNNEVYIITSDNYLFKFDHDLKQLWYMKIKLDGDQSISYIRYYNGRIYCSISNEIKTIINVDTSTPSDKPIFNSSYDNIIYKFEFVDDILIPIFDESFCIQVYGDKVFYNHSNTRMFYSVDKDLIKRTHRRSFDSFFIRDGIIYYRKNDNIIKAEFDGMAFGEELNSYLFEGIQSMIKIDTTILYIDTRDQMFLYNSYDKEISKYDVVDYSSENVWYKIPYTVIDRDTVEIDKRFTGKELMAFSKRSFLYHHTIIDKTNISGVILPQEFSYCKEWLNFMVFLNGRRLDQNAYAITTMKMGDPFTHTAIFSAIPLELNDKLEVFYLPREVEDITKLSTITTSGYIKIPFNSLPYGFNGKNCLIFLNGKKVDYKITKDIHFYKIKLNEPIETLKNLNVVKISRVDELFEQLLKGASSEWDIIMESVTSKETDILMNCNEEYHHDREESYKDYQATIKTPIYEVLYHYYLSDKYAANEIILYDFMAAGFDIDSNDIMVPGLFDASLIDKLKPL